MRMGLPRFLLFDFLGCLVSIPIWLTLGALASIYGREWLETASRSVGGGLLAAVLVGLVVFIIIIKVRASKRAKKDAEAVEAEINLSARAASSPELERP
jgi:membrane protein DedA with SNARE-associated domain